VVLTAEGRAFLGRVQTLLGLVTEMTQEMHDCNDQGRGCLKLGVPPQIGAHLFPAIFTDFASRYPNLQLSVFEEGSAATIALLEKGELDVGIVILPESTPKLATLVIRREPVVLCVSVVHRLSGRSSVDFAELRDERFILRKADSLHREIVLDLCRRHGFTPNVVLSSNQIQTIRSLVAKDVGIAFFMEMVVKNDPQLVAIPLLDPVYVNIGLAWKQGKYVSKSTQSFIDFVTDSVYDKDRHHRT
jgi:DNA-binding transcriptional LysR family regulator